MIGGCSLLERHQSSDLTFVKKIIHSISNAYYSVRIERLPAQLKAQRTLENTLSFGFVSLTNFY
jgi:hypothetical protein